MRTARAEQFVAWCSVVVVVAGIVAGLLVLPVVQPAESIPTRVLAVGLTAIGALAVRKIEGRVIGWLMILTGVSSAALDVTYSYAQLWAESPTRYPLGDWAHVMGDLMGQVSVVPMFILLPLLFPTGRVSSPRWRWVLRVALASAATSFVMILLEPTTYENEADVVVGRNPMGVGDPRAMELMATVAGLALLAVAVVAIAGFVVRVRRAEGVERLQLRWLATGFLGAAFVAASTFAIAGIDMATGGRVGFPELLLDLAMGTSVLFIPFGAGVAVTRYRLYEIDRIVSRTATYSVVVVMLVGLYVAAVLGLGAVAQAAFGDGSSDLVVALSTLLVAGAFQPVRSRVRDRVDRRFNRARFDANREVERFGGRLRHSLELRDVITETTSVAGRTVQPAVASVWLRGGGIG